MVIVLSLIAGGAAIFFLASQKPVVELAPEAKSVAPVRPMVETLSVPAVGGTGQKAANRGTSASHGGDHPGPQAREQAREQVGSAEENTQGKKKNRGASGEKRAILQEEAEVEAEAGPRTSKRPNSYDDKPSVKKNKDPRPNPF
jgi:hypothetical protein